MNLLSFMLLVTNYQEFVLTKKKGKSNLLNVQNNANKAAQVILVVDQDNGEQTECLNIDQPCYKETLELNESFHSVDGAFKEEEDHSLIESLNSLINKSYRAYSCDLECNFNTQKSIANSDELKYEVQQNLNYSLQEDEDLSNLIEIISHHSIQENLKTSLVAPILQNKPIECEFSESEKQKELIDSTQRNSEQSNLPLLLTNKKERSEIVLIVFCGIGILAGVIGSIYGIITA